MVNEKGIIIAIIMSIVLLSTGAATAIIGAFGNAMGWGFGGIMGILVILMIVLAGFNKK